MALPRHHIFPRPKKKDRKEAKIKGKLLFDRGHQFCAYCGIWTQKKESPLDEGMGRPDFTVDHIVPLARGGGNAFSNLVACCKPCNEMKGARRWKIKYDTLTGQEVKNEND
jgi:5-methylcytosine-specific restriction endonuclease McrA